MTYSDCVIVLRLAFCAQSIDGHHLVPRTTLHGLYVQVPSPVLAQLQQSRAMSDQQGPRSSREGEKLRSSQSEGAKQRKASMSSPRSKLSDIAESSKGRQSSSAESMAASSISGRHALLCPSFLLHIWITTNPALEDLHGGSRCFPLNATRISLTRPSKERAPWATQQSIAGLRGCNVSYLLSEMLIQVLV